MSRHVPVLPVRRLVHTFVIPALVAAVPMTAATAQRPAAPSSAMEIGTEDGDDRYVFGHIADVAVDSAGDVLVLDDHLHELRWYDAAGRFRAKAGREGRGPGEFGGPRAVAVATDGRVHVLDAGTARILTFRRDAGRLVHERDVRLPVRALDLCLVGARRFVLTPGEPSIVHELDGEGRVVRAFGAPEAPDPGDVRRVRGAAAAPLVRMMANQGSLHCDAARGRLYHVHSIAHLVRAFALDGRLVWRAVLPKPEAPRVEASRSRPGGVGIPLTGRLSSALDAAVAADGTVLVTLGLTHTEQRRSWYEEHRLHPADGRTLGRATGRTRVVAVRDGRRYGYVDDPYPRVLVHP